MGDNASSSRRRWTALSSPAERFQPVGTYQIPAHQWTDSGESHLSIKLSRRVIVSYIIREVPGSASDRGNLSEIETLLPLYTAQVLISFLCKSALHSNHGLEARVKEWHPQIEQLGKLGNQLVVQQVEYLLRVIMFLLCLYIEEGVLSCGTVDMHLS